uniref:Uncharacterized protein n=1 Tax=Candidatus Methanosuratincola petrocarbonis (ex Vanwonterghem et al. 2016) TaxID=1867261 RepID=A0A7J3UZ33_9CREN
MKLTSNLPVLFILSTAAKKIPSCPPSRDWIISKKSPRLPSPIAVAIRIQNSNKVPKTTIREGTLLTPLDPL